MIRRILVTTVALGSVAAALAFAVTVEEAQVAGAEVMSIGVPPVDYPVACPGQLEVPVGDFDPGDDDLASAPTERSLRVWGDGELRATDGGTGTIVEAPVASSLERAASGDIEGLAALTCTRPSTDQWLLGGSTAVGSSARLVVSNPSLASVEVVVTMFGPVGQLDQNTTLVLGPGGQSAILLEGVEAGVASLAVHVLASGAGVTAAIQDSRLDGFQPAGTDWIVPSERSDQLVIPGVGFPLADDDEVSSLLRLVAPEGATASMTLTTEEGIVPWGGTSNLELEPGVVVDVAVPEGIYGTIEVVADSEVLAAAQTTVAREAAEGIEGSLAFDFGWVAGTDNRDGSARSVVAPGGLTHVVAYSAFSATFELRNEDGDVVISQAIEPRTFVTVPVNVDEGTVLSSQGRFTWVLRASDTAGYVSFLQSVQTQVEDQDVAVVPGNYTSVP